MFKICARRAEGGNQFQKIKIMERVAAKLLRAFRQAVVASSSSASSLPVGSVAAAGASSSSADAPPPQTASHLATFLTLTGEPWPPPPSLPPAPSSATSARPASSAPAPPRSILILDSSFNPPTLAHQHLALLGLESVRAKGTGSAGENDDVDTLILLHAVANADKPATDPSDLVHRVHLLVRLAAALDRDLGSSDAPRLVVGLTTAARFVDKAIALRHALQAVHGTPRTPRTHWILGYDTVTRLLDPKYYLPPTATTTGSADAVLAALAPMFDPKTGSDGVLVLFDREPTPQQLLQNLAPPPSLFDFLAANPAARRLVDAGRVVVAKGWATRTVPTPLSPLLSPNPFLPTLDWSDLVPAPATHADAPAAIASALSSRDPALLARLFTDAPPSTFVVRVENTHVLVRLWAAPAPASLASEELPPSLAVPDEALYPADPDAPPLPPLFIVGVAVGYTPGYGDSPSTTQGILVCTLSSTAVREAVRDVSQRLASVPTRPRLAGAGDGGATARAWVVPLWTVEGRAVAGGEPRWPGFLVAMRDAWATERKERVKYVAGWWVAEEVAEHVVGCGMYRG
ncbi:hypothetical protein HDU96_004076 [Phlyctochytrium bullatum]|nr:hypothetical protein HDU96_004076 [Phlyctochytrium bullatum]